MNELANDTERLRQSDGSTIQESRISKALTLSITMNTPVSKALPPIAHMQGFLVSAMVVLQVLRSREMSPGIQSLFLVPL